MIPTTKTCGTCEHFPNDKHCVGCVWDEDKQENTKWELKENPIVIERGVLDKIRAEIDELPSYVAKFNGGDFAIHIDKEKVIDIIDKYKVESEE